VYVVEQRSQNSPGVPRKGTHRFLNSVALMIDRCNLDFRGYDWLPGLQDSQRRGTNHQGGGSVGLQSDETTTDETRHPSIQQPTATQMHLRSKRMMLFWLRYSSRQPLQLPT
jgi:hypothetical protein